MTFIVGSKEKLPLLVKLVLMGKGLFLALILGVKGRNDYEKLKDEVLKANQITPEYYKVKFRSTRKKQGQKYAEFSHLLDKYHRTLGVSTFKEMREMRFKEQFLLSVNPKVKVYLCER